METQAEYDTLKQYITANAGWSDSVLFISLSLGDMVVILKMQPWETC